MLWCLRLIGVGIGRFDGINGNYWQRGQLAGAGDVVGALAAGSDERASTRTNSLLVPQITARSSLFSPRGDQREPASMLRPAQSLHLSPRTGMHAARSPLKPP